MCVCVCLFCSLSHTNKSASAWVSEVSGCLGVCVFSPNHRVVDMDKRYRGGEDDPSVITEMNVLAVLLYAQGKMDQVIEIIVAMIIMQHCCVVLYCVCLPTHVRKSKFLHTRTNLSVTHSSFTDCFDVSLPSCGRRGLSCSSRCPTWRR